MNNQPSDSVLGDQGMSDFNSLTGPTGAASGGTPVPNTQPNQEGRNDGQTGTVPRKPADAEPGQQQAPMDGQQQSGGQPTPTPVPQQSQQSVSDIIKATAEAMVQAQGRQTPPQQQTPAAERDLTPQEFNAKYGIVEVTPDLMTAVLDQDPKKGAQTLNQIIQNNMAAAVRMAKDVFDAQIKQVRSTYDPHISSWQEHQRVLREQQAETRFFSTHPDLAAEKELVYEMKDAVLAKVRAGQLSFSNETEAFNAVANSVKKILQRVSPAGQQQSGQQQGGGGNGRAAAAPAGRQMSGASSSGRTGTGQATVKSDVDHIFGEFAR